MRLGDELERARLCIDHVLLAADRPERVVRRLELCRRVPSKHSDVARLSFETTARCGGPVRDLPEGPYSDVGEERGLNATSVVVKQGLRSG